MPISIGFSRYPLGGQDTFFAVSQLQCHQISVPLCLNFAYPQDVDDYMRKNRQDGESGSYTTSMAVLPCDVYKSDRGRRVSCTKLQESLCCQLSSCEYSA